MIKALAHRFQSGAPGRLTAAVLFIFLLTHEISGIAPLKGAAEVLLFLIAISEIAGSLSGLRRAAWNVIGLGILVFILSALFGCLLAPEPSVSFGEIKTPILKDMLAMPLAFALAVARLLRVGWDKEEISALIILALAFSGLALVIWTVVSYTQFYLKTGVLPQDPFFHRYKASSALTALPFTLVGLVLFRFGKWPVMAAIALALAIMLLTSNARGAWLGAVASCWYLYVQLKKHYPEALAIKRKHVLAVAAVLVLTLIALSGTPTAKMLITKVMAGFDTTARAGNGVWGATLEMIWEKPWLGYGYGDDVYAKAYNAMAPSRPLWFFRESIGPHNAILAHWVAAGVFGLAAILFLYGAYWLGVRKLMQENADSPYSLALLQGSLAVVLACYLVRGQVEIVRWNVFGIMVAITAWLFMASKDAASRAAANEGQRSQRLPGQ